MDAPILDLTNPTDDVNDPAGSLASVDTECRGDDVDINTASAASLASGLGVNKNIALRVIEKRPWLKGADLISVPGIGPSRLTELSTKTCATQPVLPAPSPMACKAGASTVDLQTADASTIANRLKLPRMTAGEIIEARPLPQDLTQVTTPRIPGLSGPKLDGLLKDKSICVTPAPMLASGNAYRWATGAGGTVVERDGYALIVPPGRVLDAKGSYAEINPLPADDFGIPRLEARIHGLWNSGTTTVAVQGPWVGGTDDRPAVLHEPTTGGVNLSIGPDGAVTGMVGGRPTVTAALTSLSPAILGATECNASKDPTSIATPLCLGSSTDIPLIQLWKEHMAQAGSRVGEVLQGTSTKCPPRVDLGVSWADTDGDPSIGIQCAVGAAASPYQFGTGTWTFKNNAKLDLLGLASAGVGYRYETNGALVSAEVVPDPSVSSLERALLKIARAGGHLYPRESLVAIKSPSFVTTNFTSYPDLDATTRWVGATKLVGDFMEVLNEQFGQGYNALSVVINCSELQIQCIRDSIVSGSDFVKISPSFSDRAKAKAGTVARVFKAVTAAEVATSIATAAVFASDGGFGSTDYTYLRNTPKPPASDRLGRTVRPECLTEAGDTYVLDQACQDGFYGTAPGTGGGVVADAYIARDPHGHAYLVNNQTLRFQSIATQPAYVCLARHYSVDWDAPVNGSDQLQLPGYTSDPAPAACDSSIPGRDLSPGQLSNVTLRDAQGHTYAYKVASSRNELDGLSAPDFQCLVAAGGRNTRVWDLVPTTIIFLYPQAQVETVYCGRPEF